MSSIWIGEEEYRFDVIERSAERVAAVLVAHGNQSYVYASYDLSLPEFIILVVASLISGVPILPALDGHRPMPPSSRHVDLPISPSGPSQRLQMQELPVSYRGIVSALAETSGSTGAPKTVAYSAAGCIEHDAMTLQALQWSDEDTVLTPLSFRHSYGMSILRLWYAVRFRLVLTDRKSPEAMCAHLSASQASVFEALPSTYSLLARFLHRSDQVAPALRRLWFRGCGGAPLDPSIEELMLAAGLPIHNGYGLSECGPNVSLSRPGCYRRRSVGKPPGGVETKLAADGELFVRSPAMMLGYLSDSPRSPTEWFPTGDLASIDDDGFLYLTGRKSWFLSARGHRFPPERIEEVISSSGERSRSVAANFGPNLDQIGVVIEAVATESVSAEYSLALKNVLPPHMRPSVMVFVDDLPTLPSGKPSRSAVRDLLDAESQQQ